jgi:hypothetical protein
MKQNFLQPSCSIKSLRTTLKLEVCPAGPDIHQEGFQRLPASFLAQFGSSVPLEGALKANERTWANFSGDGTGFLFINRSTSPAEVIW